MFNFDCVNNALCLMPMFGTIPFTSFPMARGVNLIALLWVFIVLSAILKNEKYYKNWFLKKYAVYLVWWLPWEWKTRFLTKIGGEIKENSKNSIIYSNYYNENSDLFFSSMADFILLQRDIQALWLELNFDFEERKEIEKKFISYFSSDQEYTKRNAKKLKKIKDLNIKIDILGLCDEFHLYLHNRSAMSNFSGEKWKKLLEMIHQTRHSKQLLLIATQDTDTLDLDLRQISDKEIEVKDFWNGLFYWFYLYKYLNLKFQNKDKTLFFQKINKMPFWFFNWFIFFNAIKKINKKLDKLQKNIYYFINNKIFLKLNEKYKKNYYIKNNKILQLHPLFSKYNLPYNTNFNVNISLNVYKEWDLFNVILEKYKENKKSFDK